ncbi:uncharacterized protein B0T15DRAFT_263473 [Chaetomium strumarium]|uniref:RRM domain-containing protein n=1 Tax=Chaetomium strumarium TaxID=1170767 RepID=A0AAJ0GN83_9PEZI|nr:hypothetical protein B0T15DRAFT_263473 [Chaetomium strumarium]
MTDRIETTSPSSTTAYVRLHVTPLDNELLKVILSSNLLPKARNISYHTIETFPEKRYGFLELPNEDADKLRKKLNGAVLKGVKIRIERARPSGIPAPLAEAAMAKEKIRKQSGEGVAQLEDKKKKRKRGAEEISGVVLEDGRKVKRGWTSADDPKEKRSKKGKEKRDKEKRKQAKSKYTDHAECLVKAVLPPNAVALNDTDHTTPTRKKKGKSREIVVHEFEKTTKFPTFLKAGPAAGRSRTPLEFVDGKGWVDEQGNVVEIVKTRPPQSAKVLLSNTSATQPPENDPDDGHTTSSSDDKPLREDEQENTELASEGGSEPESSEPEASPEPSSPSSPVKSEPLRPRSSGSVRSLSVKIPPATPNEPKVHPLEALYKRPKQPQSETPEASSGTQGFSFFADGSESAGKEGDSEVGDTFGHQVPLTPFTRQDLELRGIRSAAPTPDTAHPNHRFTPWEPEDDTRDQIDDELADENSEEDERVASNSAVAQGEDKDARNTSDFQKWFWENRGELNRSWKRRRKLAGKEKRYRENKARMARAI